jgi:hypothetical protein
MCRPPRRTRWTGPEKKPSDHGIYLYSVLFTPEKLNVCISILLLVPTLYAGTRLVNEMSAS